MPQAPSSSMTTYDRVAVVVDRFFDQLLPGVRQDRRDDLITQLVAAAASPDSPAYRGPDGVKAATAKAPADRYCVIAIDVIARRFYTNTKDAEEAAVKNIRENIRREKTARGGKVAKKMLIVKAVSVVEEAPVIGVREPIYGDLY